MPREKAFINGYFKIFFFYINWAIYNAISSIIVNRIIYRKKTLLTLNKSITICHWKSNQIMIVT